MTPELVHNSVITVVDEKKLVSIAAKIKRIKFL